MSLKKMIEPLDIQLPNYCELYFFGSTVYSEKFNDIDILIIYEKDYISLDYLLKFRHTLKDLVLRKTGMRSDIILLSKEEEEELAFLSNAKTIKLK